MRSVAPGAAGFANAVMRERLRARPGRLADAARADRAETTRSGTWRWCTAIPQWIVRAFAEALGGDLEETARLLIADNERADRCTCAPGRAGSTAVELADEVGGAPGAFSPYAVYLPGGAPGELAAVRDGRAHVQDEGSQLVAAALAGRAAGRARTSRWLDLCAGPGGKAGLLGALAAQRGARGDRGRGGRAPGPAGRAGHAGTCR